MTEIMQQEWPNKHENIRISIAPLDEFGMPMNRFSHAGKLPSDPEDYERFAKNAGELVEATILFILTGERPEEKK